MKRRPPSSIIDGPTHWDGGPWWNWQHVWLWTRRFQVRVLAGQSGQQDPAEGWPSGLRRRPAKALTRKSLVGSNPTPSASEGRCGRLERVSWVRTERPLVASSATVGSQSHPLRLSTSGLTPEASGRVAERTKAHAWRACGQQPCLVGSNPTPSVIAVSHEAGRRCLPSWVRTERPLVASSATVGSQSHPLRLSTSGLTPEASGRVAERTKAHAWRACGQQPCLVGSNPTPSVIAVSHEAGRRCLPSWVRTERPQGASSGSVATQPSDLWSRARRTRVAGESIPPRPSRKFDSGSPLGAPSPAARTGRRSFRQHPGSRHPERWQNGNAPVSKTGALTGLGVRIPPSPLKGVRTERPQGASSASPA